MPHPYIVHLSKDKIFKKIIEGRGEIQLRKRKNIPLRLCASIMSQQLNVKVAEIIFRRFLSIYGKKEPTPQQIFDTPDEVLRSIGLSNSKVNYVKNVARFALENDMSDKNLSAMPNEEIISYLTPIKGVGRWTVEMLLIFTLGREDVFAPDDLGIQNFMIAHFRLDRQNKKKFYDDMLKISQRWSPYRSFACLYMWGWKSEKSKVKS